ncbi:MAG: hypothetical protein EBU08_18200 [Micrococcales bacterium]|nr:hypothetical protein [Micrococcales bacterium]
MERELNAISVMFRTYVETGDARVLEWAFDGLAFLADRENSVGREWDYIADRHNENMNNTRESRLGAENVEVQ